MKKFLSLLLAALMLCSCAVALATDEGAGDTGAGDETVAADIVLNGKPAGPTSMRIDQPAQRFPNSLLQRCGVSQRRWRT